MPELLSTLLKNVNSNQPIFLFSGTLSNAAMETISEIRRAKLIEAIKIAGSAQRLADLIGEGSPAYISQLKNAAPSSRTGKAREMGDDFARKIEHAIKKPRGWMDRMLPTEVGSKSQDGDDNSSVVTSEEFVEIPLLWNELGAGNGAILEDYDLVNGKLAYRRDWIAKRGLVIEMLRILPVKGDSMVPYVFHGNKVLVNTAAKRIIDGEHYAIRVGDQAKVKRLFKQPDGKIRVESYNALTEFIGPGDDAEVLGHVVDRKGTSNSNGG